MRKLANELAKRIRLGHPRTKGWHEVTVNGSSARGQCNNRQCRAGVPSPSWRQGVRLFYRSRFDRNPHLPNTGVITSSNPVCVVCAMNVMMEEESRENRNHSQVG